MLDNIPALKNKHITQKEQDEYKRTYAAKNTLSEYNPGVDVCVERGKLYVGEDLIDQIKTSSKIF